MDFNAKNVYNVALLFLLSSFSIDYGLAVPCYECDSSVDMTCGESLADGHTLEPSDCMHLQEPLYCVKMTGLYEGQLGTKRFCSARDFGNYCEMAQRPGDERLYRACVYTCSGHACNPASSQQPKYALVIGAFVSIFITSKIL